MKLLWGSASWRGASSVRSRKSEPHRHHERPHRPCHPCHRSRGMDPTGKSGTSNISALWNRANQIAQFMLRLERPESQGAESRQNSAIWTEVFEAYDGFGRADDLIQTGVEHRQALKGLAHQMELGRAANSNAFNNRCWRARSTSRNRPFTAVRTRQRPFLSRSRATAWQQARTLASDPVPTFGISRGHLRLCQLGPCPDFTRIDRGRYDRRPFSLCMGKRFAHGLDENFAKTAHFLSFQAAFSAAAKEATIRFHLLSCLPLRSWHRPEGHRAAWFHPDSNKSPGLHRACRALRPQTGLSATHRFRGFHPLPMGSQPENRSARASRPR